MGLGGSSQKVVCSNCGKVIRYVMNRPHKCYYCRTEL